MPGADVTRAVAATSVHRAVVVAGLVACVALVVAVVEGVATLAGRGPGNWGWLGGAVLVAVLVPLVRPRLEWLADRAAFGRQGDPYAVLADFVQRISDTLAVDDVLPYLARTAAQATRSASGGVRLWLADGEERHEVWPPEAVRLTGDVSMILEHAGEPVGRLEVAGADDTLRDTDRELLSRLAGPAGVALSNVRLTVELRRRLAQTTALAEQLRLSRQRLLESRRTQRERFLAAVRRQVLSRLDAVDAALSPADGQDVALTAAERAAVGCLESLRELAAGVYPPALEQRGVGAALERHADHHGEPVTVRDGLGTEIRYRSRVESAAYFCCVAVTDEVASAGPATVELSGDWAALTFRVASPARLSGRLEELVRDRVEALGGSVVVDRSTIGCVVQGRLPADPAAATSGEKS